MGIVFQFLHCSCGWTNTNDSRHVVRIHGFLLTELLNSLSLPLQADQTGLCGADARAAQTPIPINTTLLM
jgi:hypothetical protein